eukprot:TRINITY_DN18208_c0_g1_i1.p1 TRINITY_DN18208_c0_g1~~TRINITY_DN18208_c0_g1_i1.p1  ORF type:complete len:472 (+),score=78.18 TRINITY_DN18208_c0_g1_i1:119-1534(+)
MNLVVPHPGGRLPPFPTQPMGPPPWANFHTTVALLRASRPKPDQIDREMYPPGVNPIFSHPVATMPHAITPAPNTPQYGGPYMSNAAFSEMPSPSLRFGGWTQARLRSTIDSQGDTVAQKLHEADDGAPWYYAEVDGWALNFYAKHLYDPYLARLGRVRPEATVDLRGVRRTQITEPIHWNPPSAYDWHRVAEIRVTLILASGLFSFLVRHREEAEQWCRIASMAVAENQSNNLRHKQEAIQDAREFHAKNHRITVNMRDPVGQQATPSHHVPNDRRRELRVLWGSCVKAIGSGYPVPLSAFEGIYTLYDVNGDGNLAVDEIETMTRDLFSIRKDEVERAMDRNVHSAVRPDQLLLDCRRETEELWGTVETMGKKLLQDYQSKLSKEGFESRCLLLRSQLDFSADSILSVDEFLQQAPRILLPERELKEEALFYSNCSKAIRRSKKAEFWVRQQNAESDDSDEEEGICVQQ